MKPQNDLLGVVRKEHPAYNGADEASWSHKNPLDPGYFALLVMRGERLRQECFPLRLLLWVLQALNPRLDTYIAQNEFWRRNRRLVNLARICLNFVDLDLSRTGELSGDPARDLDLLFQWHHWGPYPFPSAIIFSGRGYHLKWFYERPISSLALPRWNAVQRALTDRYAELGADPGCRDASRVLRVVGCVNSKSGKTVEVLYPYPGGPPPVEYDFEDVCREVLPYTREEMAGWRAAAAERAAARETARAKWEGTGNGNLRRGALNWARFIDLRTLAGMRMEANGGKMPEGQRMTHLFWQLNFLMLAMPGPPSMMWHEAAALATRLDPAWGYASPELGTLYRKAKDASEGKRVEFGGREHPCLYTPKSQTLIDIFGITPDEMPELRTIITPGEAKARVLRRDEERRREAGRVPREDYLESVAVSPEDQAQAARERDEARRRAAGRVAREAYLEAVEPASESMARARELRERGCSLRDIALETGVSVATLSRKFGK